MNRRSATIIAATIFAGSVCAAGIWKEDPQVLACSPAAVGPNGKIVLELGPKHGRELAIRRHSDGVWFFLVVQAAPREMKSLMSRAEFAKARRVVLEPSVTGYAWVEGRGNEKIFTTAGKYSVHVSDVLESERGGHTCTITYTPS
jgi:hypothetical protein